MAQLPPVTGVTARYQGIGNANNTTNYYYWVQALYVEGYAQLSASANTGAYAAAGLSTDNLVAVKWNPAPGAIGYLVYRSTSSTTPADGATAIFIASSETGFSDNGTYPTFVNVPRYDSIYMWRALYNAAVDSKAQGAVIPVLSDTIPKNAIVFGGVLNCPTAVTSSGSATVSVGTSAGSGAATILAATGKASLTANVVIELLGTNSQAATQKPPFKMSAAGQINITIGTADLLAGVIEIMVFGTVTTNS